MIRFVTLLVFLHKLYALRWDGINLFDLEATTLPDLAAEASDWVLSSYVTAQIKVSSCGAASIMGGANILGGNPVPSSNPYRGQYFQRTYNSLPVHNQIFLQMLFYSIDAWDGSCADDTFTIEIDGVVVQGYCLSVSMASSNLCGQSSSPDIAFTIYLAHPHAASSLNLKVRVWSNEDSQNESIGFRDIQIAFVHMATPYNSLCQSGASLTSSNCVNSCTAAANVITPSGSGFCYLPSCGVNCKTCSSSPSYCTSCKGTNILINGACFGGCNPPFYSLTLGGGIVNCFSPCGDQFLWWDNSCSSVCSFTTSSGFDSFSLQSGSSNSLTTCKYPCNSQFLFWNSSCLATCPTPLTPLTFKGQQFCQFGCPQGQFLYWNGSCLDQCELPLVAENQQGRKFCWYKCLDSQFLYWNGSCLNECESPLTARTQGVNLPKQFCVFECTDTQFLYWNKSCAENCPAPLVTDKQQGTSSTRNFCWFPCEESQFLFWNGSCKSSCPSPLVSELQQGTSSTRGFCWFPCSSLEILYWNGSCKATCPSPLVLEIQQGAVSSASFCWYPCTQTQFLYWNGSCLETCAWPLIPEVQSGLSSSRQYCWYPCQQTEFLYWNGSCIETCPSPLIPEVQTGLSSSRQYCWYPCKQTEVLYWNGSCSDQCDSRLRLEVQGISQTWQFCWPRCDLNHFVYWNSSCSATCPLPLVQTQDPQILFCENPCSDPTSFLHKNQSCLSSCSSPLRIIAQPGVQYCVNPCETTDLYLFQNQTCLGSCASPFVERSEPNTRYCDPPCTLPNLYWYQNATCLRTCEPPYLQSNWDGILMCMQPCPDAEWFYSFEKACFSSCDHPYQKELVDGVLKVCKIGITVSLTEILELQEAANSIKKQSALASGGIKIASVLNPQSPSSALLAGLSSMMQYIRYMRIDYPPRVQGLFMVSAASPVSINFGASIPSFIAENLNDRSLPAVFERYDIDSNFVRNLWSFMVSLTCVLFVIFLVLIIKCMLTRLTKITKILNRGLQFIKWNLPLAMICGSSGDVIFYACLQLRSSPFLGMWSVICSITSILMVVLVFSLLVVTVAMAVRLKDRRRLGPVPQARIAHGRKVWKGCEVLFNEYEESSIFSLAYISLFIARGFVFNLTIAVLFDYPFLQCLVISACNLAMISYLIYLRPLKDLFALVQLWINEGLVALLSISVLILGILDKIGLDRKTTRVGVGNVIIFVIQTFNIIALIFVALEILKWLLCAMRAWRTLRLNNKVSPLELFKALFDDQEEPKKDPIGTTNTDLSSSVFTTSTHGKTSIQLQEDESIDNRTDYSHHVREGVSLGRHKIGLQNVFPLDQQNPTCKGHMFSRPPSGGSISKHSLEMISFPRDLDIEKARKEPEASRGVVQIPPCQDQEVSPQGSESEIKACLEGQHMDEGTRSWYRRLRNLKRRLNAPFQPLRFSVDTNMSSQS